MTESKKTRSIGLRIALFGDVNPEGGMPKELKQLAKTLKGTASFTTETGQTQEFYSEEEPEVPEETVETEPGLKQAKLSFLEWDNETLTEVFGGSVRKEQVTVEGKTYQVDKFVPPRSTVVVEKALRLVSRYNVVIDIPRARVKARFVWNLTNTDIAQIEVTATCLSPIGEKDGFYEVYKLGAPVEATVTDGEG